MLQTAVHLVFGKQVSIDEMTIVVWIPACVTIMSSWLLTTYLKKRQRSIVIDPKTKEQFYLSAPYKIYGVRLQWWWFVGIGVSIAVLYLPINQ